MKKFLMSCAALSVLALPSAGHAADLVARPVVAAAPAVNWTGCYIGIHAGAGWGDKWWSDRLVQDNVSYATSGWVTGAQLGCDFQSGPVVIGAEGTWSWTNLDGNGAPANLAVLGAPAQLYSTIDSIATAGARVGLVADRALIYVKVQRPGPTRSTRFCRARWCFRRPSATPGSASSWAPASST
jgi:outer membrane immunogenic protein